MKALVRRGSVIFTGYHDIEFMSLKAKLKNEFPRRIFYCKCYKKLVEDPSFYRWNTWQYFTVLT